MTIVVEPRGEYRIVAADDLALGIGIKPGLKLSAAYALSGSLQVYERRSILEQGVLEGLAQWVRRFTPVVSLASPRELLMEVGGSLELFGGLKAIKNALRAECERRQLTVRLCAAPTALAALWLVRHGGEDALYEGKLAGELGKLPLGVTEWPERTQASLRSMGVRTLGDCLRLPRDGFIRRIGRDYLHDLDRSLGGFDSRTVYEPPHRFSSTLELAGEITDPAILACAGKQLIEALAAVLCKHQVGVASFEIAFKHFHCPATVERISLAGPTRDRERFLRLFLDRLDRLSLPAPVVTLVLRSGHAEPVVERSSALFGGESRPESAISIDGLVERLRGRFGSARIFGINLVAEHRPEAAWSKSLDGFSVAERDGPISPWAISRPLWLLPQPLSLPDSPDGLPRYRSREPLRPRCGPERIETGWWNGEEIRRDYYTATTRKGEMLWIFRDRCKEQGWFLHGIFG
ncbi:MAG TPA: DNA polymerase Y family protein [Gammaproteobacteria bacterium]